MKAFFAGALTAAPVTAIIMWLVLGAQARTDTRVELQTAKADLHRAEDLHDFNRRWQAGAIAPASSANCDAPGQDLARLRERVAELQRELQGAREKATADAAALDQLVNGKADNKLN